MIKVITYGTYDLFHMGHQLLLERAKALGDYLIVAVTADDFDKNRGKVNVKQSLSERIENVRKTGLADEIIIEEYEGQKIDDIIRYGIDIFTVGSDWKGKFDYLKEYCKVVYLPRTEGVSSSEIRCRENKIRIGFAGEQSYINKYLNECSYVNGIEISGLFSGDKDVLEDRFKDTKLFSDYETLLNESDAVYIASKPELHYPQIKLALQKKKHVLCESPVAMSKKQCNQLFRIAEQNGVILMDCIKTAYSTAFHRLTLLAKTGKIGKVVNIEATCTSLLGKDGLSHLGKQWKSICAWGPTAMLPIYQILGTKFQEKTIITKYLDRKTGFDAFTRVNFIYKNATASINVGKGVKSEGELIVSGTKGYFYIPAPWWKTDYFEIRYENPAENKRYFFSLEGEGIRNAMVSFAKSIQTKHSSSYIDMDISGAICSVIDDFENKVDVREIKF